MYIPKRFIVTAYTFLGFVVMLYLRANLSIAIVDMTSDKNITTDDSTYVEKAEFNWTPLQLGIILSAFNYGYFFSPPGGMLAARYGGATLFGLGVLITGCLTVLTPFFCRISLMTFILTRMLEGIFEAFSMASTIVIFVHWAPPEERARLTTFSFAGAYLGTSLNYPISGYVTKEYGWEAVFYVSGAIAVLWYLLWISFVTNHPDQHKSISEEERVYLRKANNHNPMQQKISYPWKKITMSKEVWAFLVHRFANSWASVFVLLCLPIYFRGLFQMSIADIGILASIPNIVTIIIQPIAAIMFDCIRNRNCLSSTRVHKVFTCGSYLFNGIILFLATQCTNYTCALICFVLLRLSSSYGETSYYTLPADLSPTYSGLLSGIGTAFYSLGSLLSPTVLGYIVSDLHDQRLWNIYFLLLSGIMFTAGIIFLIFGSGDLQRWDEDKVCSAEMNERRRRVVV